MTELKTQPNDSDVNAFLNGVEDDTKRTDAFELVEIMKRLTGDEPQMWGGSIIGFGDYGYTTRDGKDHKWFRVGFSPRKQNLTLYIMTGFERSQDLMDQLGKYSTGKSCLYIKKLEDVDHDVLEKLISESLDAFEGRTDENSLIT